jgi:hypothetical protein
MKIGPSEDFSYVSVFTTVNQTLQKSGIWAERRGQSAERIIELDLQRYKFKRFGDPKL